MDDFTDFEKLDVMKWARSIEKDCQEGVKWEIRKLEWILEDKRKAAEVDGKDKAA